MHETIIDTLFVKPVTFVGETAVDAVRAVDDAQQSFFLGVSKRLVGELPEIQTEEEAQRLQNVAQNFGSNVAGASLTVVGATARAVASLPGEIGKGAAEGIAKLGPALTGLIIAGVGLALALVVFAAIAALKIF